MVLLAMPPFRPRHHDVPSPQRERLLLWQSQRLLAAAVGACTLAFPWLAFTLGYGPVLIAACVAAQLLPITMTSLIAGPLVRGRWSRRRILVGAQGTFALSAIGVLASDPNGGVLLAGAALCGLARAVFDTTSSDILHHLVGKERKASAIRDLTARFAEGHAIGVVGGLLLGLAAGPGGALALGAGAAILGSAVSARHHLVIGLRVHESPHLGSQLRPGFALMAERREIRVSQFAGAIGIALAGAQAALLVPWFREAGLVGAMLPASLLAGLLVFRLAFVPAQRLIARSRDQQVISGALALEGVGFIVVHAASSVVVASVGHGLGLLAVACLGSLANRARLEHAHPDVSPAAGLAGAALWAAAASAGALAGAGLASLVGIGSSFVLLAAAGLSAAAFSWWWSRRSLGVNERLLAFASRRL